MKKRGVARRIGAVVLVTGAVAGVTATQAQADSRQTYYGAHRSTSAQAWSDTNDLAFRCRGADDIDKFVINSVAQGYRTYQAGVTCIWS